MGHFTTETSGLNSTLALEAVASAASATPIGTPAVATAIVDTLIGSVTGMPEIGAEPNFADVSVFNQDVAPQVKGQRTRGATAITVAMVRGDAGQAELDVALKDGKSRYFRLRIATTPENAADLTVLTATDAFEDFYFLAQVASYSPSVEVGAEASASIGLAIKSAVYGPLTT